MLFMRDYAFLPLKREFIRVVYQFGIFGRYLVGISWYLLNQYRRKTRYISVLFFGGKHFFPQKGGHGPLFEGPSPHFEGKNGFPPNLKEFPPISLVLKILTKTPTDHINTDTGQAASKYQNDKTLDFM